MANDPLGGLSAEKISEMCERQRIQRERRMILAIQAGVAWHPDVTALELEQAGERIENKAKEPSSGSD